MKKSINLLLTVMLLFVLSVAPSMSGAATRTPTRAVTATPTKAVTPTPTKAVTVTPTKAVTSTPTKAVTVTPTRAVTPTPTRAVTVTPTRAVTPTPTLTQLVILHTNDTHGHPLKFKDSKDDVGGIPGRFNLVNQVRCQYENVLVLDAGDLNTGRPESNFFQAAPDIRGFNCIGYDTMALGNHEFDNDLGILGQQMKKARFPFLSANVKRKSDGKYIGQPYIIKEFNGFKVAIFGLTTSEMQTSGNPKVIGQLIIEDEMEVAKKLVPELRKKADVVIALTHMGIYDDERGSKRLAKNVPGIDLIVDGHTHTQLQKPIYVNQVPIVQDWQWGLTLGKGVLALAPQMVKNSKGKWEQTMKVTGFSWETLALNQKPLGPGDEDPPLLATLKTYGDVVDQLLKKEIGTAGGDFPNKDSRKQETALGDLAADSMYWYFKKEGHPVDFALNNGGGTRADLPQGPITKASIYAIEPFDNSVVALTLKGTDVQALFEYIAKIPRGDGGFPQVSDGVKFTINYSTKTPKCENILIGGQPLDSSKQYRIATNSYLASGGNGYEVFKAAEKYDTSIFQRDMFIDYICSFGVQSIAPVDHKRITIIDALVAKIFAGLKRAA